MFSFIRHDSTQNCSCHHLGVLLLFPIIWFKLLTSFYKSFFIHSSHVIEPFRLLFNYFI
jgi:hypothetical protein